MIHSELFVLSDLSRPLSVTRWKAKVHFLKGLKPVGLRLKRNLAQSSYDYGIVTSKTTVAFLPKRLPTCKKWIFIGENTAKVFFRRYRKVPCTILKRSDEKGLTAFFMKRKERGKTVFFPRSKRGDPQLATNIQKSGYRVKVVHPYTVRILSLRKRLKPRLEHWDPTNLFWILLTSPSTVEVLKKSLSQKERKTKFIRYLVIGETTALAFKGLKLPFKVSPQASLEKMIRFVISTGQ